MPSSNDGKSQPTDCPDGILPRPQYARYRRTIVEKLSFSHNRHMSDSWEAFSNRERPSETRVARNPRNKYDYLN